MNNGPPVSNSSERSATAADTMGEAPRENPTPVSRVRVRRPPGLWNSLRAALGWAPDLDLRPREKVQADREWAQVQRLSRETARALWPRSVEWLAPQLGVIVFVNIYIPVRHDREFESIACQLCLWMLTFAWTIFRTRAVLLKHFNYSIERRTQTFIKDNSNDAFIVSSKFSKLGYALGAFLIFLFVAGFGSLSVSHYRLQLLEFATKSTTVSGEIRFITTGAWPAIYCNWTVDAACALSFFIISWLPPRAGKPPVTQTDLWFLKKDHNRGKSYLIFLVLAAAYSCAAAAGMEVALCCLIHVAFLGLLSWHVCVAICKDAMLHVRRAEDDLAVAAFE